MATTLTTPTTFGFQRDPTPTYEAKSKWQLPQLPSVFRETPHPPLKLNLTVVGVVGFILCAQYTIWVSIHTKLIVLSLFLTLSDLPTTLTTICFQRDPTPTLEAESEWQLPSLSQLPSVFKETPSPLLPCVYSILFYSQYTIWVSILTESIVKLVSGILNTLRSLTNLTTLLLHPPENFQNSFLILSGKEN